MKKISAQVFLVLAMFGLHGSPVRAENVAGIVSITDNYAYGDYAANGGGADVVFNFSAAISDCAGGWILPGQPGAKTLVAILLASKLASRPVYIVVDRAYGSWSGANRYCRVFAMGLQ